MNNKEKIKERIWKTKKARICMEARVIKENKRINNWIFGFSISLVILSLLGFLEPQITDIVDKTSIKSLVTISFKLYGIVNIILSIILLCFTIKLDVENQVNRVWMIRHCYTELAKLEFSDKDSEELNNNYQDILVRYENHETKDYIESIGDNKTQKINFLKKFLIWLLFIILLLVLIIIYLKTN